MIRGISSKSLTRVTVILAQGLIKGLSHADKEAWLADHHKLCLHANTAEWWPANTASHRFHFSNFRYFLTLFSKFFSSFPHGTCSLSVSHQYLALDGIYHPLRAAIPSNSTRWKPAVRYQPLGIDGTVTLHGAPFQETLPNIDNWLDFSRLQFRRFSVWALPASLAVTEGILVSFFSSA